MSIVLAGLIGIGMSIAVSLGRNAGYEEAKKETQKIEKQAEEKREISSEKEEKKQ